jgi:hypothetical protein
VNLLKETQAMLASRGKTPLDVRWVGTRYPNFMEGIAPRPNEAPFGTWEEFAAFASFEYDAGSGGAEVNTDLVIVGDDWWLERGEYDGSEWWDFKQLPTPPKKRQTLLADDLRERD